MKLLRMKWSHFTALSALILMVAVVPAAAGGAASTYNCTVEKFTTFSSGDPVFIANNLEKTFTVTVTDEQVRVDMQSTHFLDGTTIYPITQRRNTSVTGVDGDPIRLGAITLPKDPKPRLARNGYFNAVINISGSFYSNNWLLRCSDQNRDDDG